ncbi:sigma-70 family RNA polymerase sigma factor [Clostridium tagluense]|uniref:RNA polymerase sigma factor n=1 Tax=Clostridium tagluense TaxID=360422 RepID=UPI001CF44095|nr:sigma-70 family RNA polymerase sigma factor [Clostridium tagluense]MCB2313778.1 sigma-70 family RNA polymerase sigma factor [Clostridium tagluense]MCB2318595.1 sigma-70 family RNA polymerase sigma factor [Clostridium tagluense]MCB2323441.1 sigma-70 family RNA polymerase sigma factor [Clostridium tagluense]MCB2328266.1 sigma-70 family RNA polymerase sigma factor [Clostridium tagluense]MCB2333077.1 sigma-70 family RNA polymerase sigma factor [Clostridium tagluense]
MIKNIFNMNKENFKEIYDTNFNYVYSFVFLRLGANKEATEDIVQETFISAMKGLISYKCTSSCKTWLCGIAKNKILNYYRDNIRKEGFACVEELDYVEDNQDIELMLINLETRKVILETLNNLKPIYKYVLILKYIDDYSVKGIAKCLCKTPKAIDGILQRSKNSFKKEFIKISGDELYDKRG